MNQPEPTKKQQDAIKRVDRSLTDNQLTTYSVMENQLGMALTAAWESVEMGKQIVTSLDRKEAENKILREQLDRAERTIKMLESGGEFDHPTLCRCPDCEDQSILGEG